VSGSIAAGSQSSRAVERCLFASASIRLASTAKRSPPTSPSATHRRRRLEDVAEEVAVAEPSVPVLGEGRMVRDRVRQVEPTEPPVGEVEMDLLAQPPLRADAEAVAHEQHPDHQLRIDRRPAGRTVERRQTLADVTKLDEPVDRPQQVILGDVPFERELVEQRTLRHLPRSHHRLRPPPASR
jgi:hypothetical protein